jgi:ketosteroid isomerase-like protein
VRAWLEGVRAAFGPPAYVIEDARESGDRVAVLIHLQGRGPSSEIEVDYRFTAVMTFHGERIVRMDRYDDWAAAIAALER